VGVCCADVLEGWGTTVRSASPVRDVPLVLPKHCAAALHARQGKLSCEGCTQTWRVCGPALRTVVPAHAPYGVIDSG
jgi:hypothetical protein